MKGIDVIVVGDDARLVRRAPMVEFSVFENGILVVDGNRVGFPVSSAVFDAGCMRYEEVDYASSSYSKLCSKLGLECGKDVRMVCSVSEVGDFPVPAVYSELAESGDYLLGSRKSLTPTVACPEELIDSLKSVNVNLVGSSLRRAIYQMGIVTTLKDYLPEPYNNALDGTLKLLDLAKNPQSLLK